MKFVLILLCLLSQNSVYAQSDLELVKSFGKALESTPSLAHKNASRKSITLDQIWNRNGGAKEKLQDYIGHGEEFNDSVIYNAQKYLSSFLIEAYDTKNTNWIREIASLYEGLHGFLTEDRYITFNFPTYAPDEPARLPLKAERNFKLWLNPADKNGYQSENEISSSQFLYAVSVIIHYAAQNNLENDEDFKRFIKLYYPVAMHDHYLRWILNRGIPNGTFTVKGWKCNSGSFSHKDYIEHLKNKRYGTEYFKNYGQREINPWPYCNFYRDRDGWIALGVAHLMAAHKLKPSLLPIDPATFKELKGYLQNSIDLFVSRSKYEDFKTPSGSKVDIMVFDKGGYYGHSDLKYSGYTGNDFPGWTDPAGENDEKKRIVKIPASKAPEVSWDISHARRFVNFYWSFDKIISTLGLEFKTLERSRRGYANNLYYKATKVSKTTVNFTNFICGNNGWYRVNYREKANAGNKPYSLSKHALTGGQAYFIKDNPLLNEPMEFMFKKHIKASDISTEFEVVCDELNSTASMPENFFNSF